MTSTAPAVVHRVSSARRPSAIIRRRRRRAVPGAVGRFQERLDRMKALNLGQRVGRLRGHPRCDADDRPARLNRIPFEDSPTQPPLQGKIILNLSADVLYEALQEDLSCLSGLPRIVSVVGAGFAATIFQATRTAALETAGARTPRLLAGSAAPEFRSSRRTTTVRRIPARRSLRDTGQQNDWPSVG